MPTPETSQQASVYIENVGGIETSQVQLSPGVTVLSGRNATNRTSFLRAVMGALGSREVSLRAGSASGRVELELEGETYVRTLSRTEDGVAMDGDTYLSDPTVADLFAFLLRSNPARRAILQRSDLRDVIMEPVDTGSIRDEIRRLEDRRRELDRELEELDSLDSRLPSLEQERANIEAEVRQKRDALEEIQASIASVVEADDANQTEPEHLERLRETRQDLQAVRRRIETERESIAALREDRARVQEALEERAVDGSTDPAELDREIDRLRDQKHRIESTISRLQQIHQFNARVLEDGAHPFDRPESAALGKDPTDRLVSNEAIECWTCGSRAERAAIESTQDRLRELIDDHRDQQDTVDARLSTLVENRETLEETRRERRELQERLDDLQAELDDRQRRLDDQKADRAELEATIETLETAVADADTAGHEELVTLHQEASELEYDIERLEEERETISARIRSIEADLDRRAALEETWEDVQSELLSQRSKIEGIETEAIEAFNSEMETVRTRLGYENIARIWIERITDDAGADDARFELNVVRETDGVTHEDRLDHLSESEREVTGLVFALAGYLVHDVHETVPFILLDSLEAIDAERIARLIDYFEGYARYLLVALLPEDASALDGEHHRISEIPRP